jgi:predicted amidohydrolase
MPASSAMMDVCRQGRVNWPSFVLKAILSHVYLTVGVSLKVGFTELGIFL